MKCTCGELTALNVVHRSDGPCYKPEPQRQWVGLTDEEIDTLDEANWDKDRKSWGIHTFARSIEAKLKEKNT